MSESGDRHFMGIALDEAVKAAQAEEIPIGAVLVLNGELIAQDHNRCVGTKDPTAHAEVLVIREAARRLKNYRLPGSHLYVTVEPCAMCVGAMIQARIARLVFGVTDEKTGVVESQLALLSYPFLNHRVESVGGILARECRQVVQAFFKRKRDKAGRLRSFPDLPELAGPEQSVCIVDRR
jgi:tRNA(adenine34) deaminase